MYKNAPSPWRHCVHHMGSSCDDNHFNNIRCVKFASDPRKTGILGILSLSVGISIGYFYMAGGREIFVLTPPPPPPPTLVSDRCRVGAFLYGGGNANRRFIVCTHLVRPPQKSGNYDGHIAILKLETPTTKPTRLVMNITFCT